MRKLAGAVLLFAGSTALGACATTPPTPPPASVTRLAITDLKSLVGKWEGLGQGPSSGSVLGGHSADWVEFTIKENGTYEARSYREIGVFRGTGTLTLNDNALHYTSDRSRGVLYRSDGTIHERLTGRGHGRANHCLWSGPGRLSDCDPTTQARGADHGNLP